MRILVTGSRDWDDWQTIHDALLLAAFGMGFACGEIILVHGDCPTGADWCVEDCAKGTGWATEPHPADWDKHGKAAGPIRNQKMVDAGADICLAFIKNKSRGATHCADAAEKAGIPVLRWTA